MSDEKFKRGFKMIPPYSDYGDVSIQQNMRRLIKYINGAIDSINSDLIDFGKEYDDLVELSESFDSFLEAWDNYHVEWETFQQTLTDKVDGDIQAILDSNAQFQQEVTTALNSWLDSPELEQIISDKFDSLATDFVTNETFNDSIATINGVIGSLTDDVTALSTTVGSLSDEFVSQSMFNTHVSTATSLMEQITLSVDDLTVDVETLGFEKQDKHITLPKLETFAYLAHGNKYGQGMYVDELNNKLYVGTPKMSVDNAKIWVYNLESAKTPYDAPLITSKEGEFGHIGSITKLGDHLYSTYQSGSNRVTKTDISTLDVVEQIDVGRNLAAISYNEEQNCFFGIETDNENSTLVKINLVKYDNNFTEIAFKTYLHYRPKTTWWVQGLASHGDNFVITYTDALDHDKAKHGESGMIEVRYSDLKLLGDYKFNRLHNAYFEMEAVQITGDNIYFGFISNNYEYSAKGTGYEVFKGNLNDLTPYNDIEKMGGVLVQVYYDKNYTGVQKGTPLHPYSDFAFMMDDIESPNVDIVLQSDVTTSWTSKVYTNYNYLRISGNDNTVTGLLDFRGINSLEIRNTIFNHSSYWGALVLRNVKNFLVSNCTFQGGENNPCVGVLGGQGRLSGCTFNARHAIATSDLSVTQISSAKGTVNEIAWLVGTGIVSLINNDSLTSSSNSRDSHGLVIVKGS